MKKLLLMVMLLTVFNTQAKESEHFNFYAENRFSTVFIEKCKVWRNALQNEDVELALSFFDPDIVKQHQKSVNKHIQSQIRELKRTTSLEGYHEQPLWVGKKTQPHHASVKIDWEAKPAKARGGTSCAFKKISPNHWRLN